MELKTGSRWMSAVCDTEVIVVRAPTSGLVLECGGHPMAPHDGGRPAGLELLPEHAAGTGVGKRFTDDASGLEVLCVKAGAGSLSLGGRPIAIKEAKKLPASD